MKDENCIFCKILAGEIPSTAVYEDDDFKAILDVNPAAGAMLSSCPRIMQQIFTNCRMRTHQRS